MSGGTQNRRSPSGALTDKIFEQFIGMNAVPAAGLVRYIALGSPGVEAAEPDAQLAVPEQGLLIALGIENIVLGDTPADSVTYRARLNGATIIRPPGSVLEGTPAEATLSNTAPVTIIPINIDIKGALLVVDPPSFTPADLLSVEAESGLQGGTSPKVRVTVIWTPGRVELFTP
jgi:hypothetical protein